MVKEDKCTNKIMYVYTYELPSGYVLGQVHAMMVEIERENTHAPMRIGAGLEDQKN
jgi:hypothetical protein